MIRIIRQLFFETFFDYSKVREMQATAIVKEKKIIDGWEYVCDWNNNGFPVKFYEVYFDFISVDNKSASNEPSFVLYVRFDFFNRLKESDIEYFVVKRGKYSGKLKILNLKTDLLNYVVGFRSLRDSDENIDNDAW